MFIKLKINYLNLNLNFFFKSKNISPFQIKKLKKIFNAKNLCKNLNFLYFQTNYFFKFLKKF